MVITEAADDCVRIRLASGVTNAVTTEVARALSRSIADAQGQARGILLCGGDKFFSNGADLAWALQQSSAGMRELFLELGACVVALMESPVPVVGVMKGHAIGAGMALLTACDYRYGASGRALLGKPEILMGVPNPHYADQVLRFIAGDFIASDLIYSGRMITAEEACSLNIIHAVADKQSIETVAWQRLLTLRDLPPQGFAESKRMRTGRLCAELREQMSARVARQVEIWNSAAAQRLLTAAAARMTR